MVRFKRPSRRVSWSRIMPVKSSTPAIPLPRGWSSHIKSAMLHVISLAQFAMAYPRGWAPNSPNARVRLKAEHDRSQQEVALLNEELRIHRARMAQLPPHRRPYYPPTALVQRFPGSRIFDRNP